MILSSELSSSLLNIFQVAMRRSSPVIFPTDTIYGIGAFVDNVYANRKIYEIKKRQIDKPFPLLISSVDMLKEYVDDISDEAVKLLENVQPTTVILNVNSRLDNVFKKDNTTAFRIPKKVTLQRLIERYGYPLTATSVNESGDEFMNEFDKIVDFFSDNVSVFIEGVVTSSQSKLINLAYGKAEEIR